MNKQEEGRKEREGDGWRHAITDWRDGESTGCLKKR